MSRTTEPRHDEVLLLRVWSEENGTSRIWRASLRHSDQLSRMHFQSPEALLTYLRAHFARLAREHG